MHRTTFTAIATTPLLALFLFDGCTANPIDPAAARRVVEDCQLAMLQRGDYEAYIAAFTPDSKMVFGRGPEPAATDIEYTFAQFSRSRRLRFAGRPMPSVAVEFTGSSITPTADGARLEHRVLVSVPDHHYQERLGEHYDLRQTDQGWRIAVNRFWPLQIGNLKYDDSQWAALDYIVASCRIFEDLEGEADALFHSQRYPECHAVAQRWTAAVPTAGEAWYLRGLAAGMIGAADDSLAAFAALRALKPRAQLPEWVVTRLAEQGK
jgi:hypothetical protein